MEDIRGMTEDGIDFGGMTKNWKPIAIVVVGLALVALLGYLALGVVNPDPITMVFEEDVVSAGDSTTLMVAVTNTGEIDAKNVTIQIEPESGVITVTDSQRVEATIGSKARRQFDFTVNVDETATPGTYKIIAKATNLGTEEQIASVYLEVE